MMTERTSGSTGMDKRVQQWHDQAVYDLDTADAMLASGRYLYVVFCCQQAAEKMLKAIIVQRTGELPPRIHNLLRLADLAEVGLDEEKILLCGALVGYYIQSRYPAEMEDLAAKSHARESRILLCNTKEMIEWLQSMLQ
jgi:HEPN domain-containing protein